MKLLSYMALQRTHARDHQARARETVAGLLGG